MPGRVSPDALAETYPVENEPDHGIVVRDNLVRAVRRAAGGEDREIPVERMTLAEIHERFGRSNERRQELFARFEEWLSYARATGSLRRVWIVGSWVMEKAMPADIDVVALFTAGFEPEILPFDVRNWFRQELLQSLFEIDLFYFTESMPAEMVSGLLEWFALGRESGGAAVEVDL